jgi:hypothetical protein
LVVLGLVVGVNAGLLLLSLVVGVNAGLLLLSLVVYLGWLICLSLLATARGGASFLLSKATKKRSKENAFKPRYPKCPQRAVSIHRCPKSMVLARAEDV